MKRVLLSLVVIAGLAFGTTSCSKAKKAADKTVEATQNAANKVGDAANKAGDVVKDGVNAVADAVTDTKQVTRGKELFASKTCATCHGIDKKILGPTVKEIVKVYAEKGANMAKFLKGNGEAIVDTDAGQVAIMKANIDGFLKEMKAEDIQALTAYMRSVGK